MVENLDLLANVLTAEQLDEIKASARNYGRFAQVKLRVLEYDPPNAVVRIKQLLPDAEALTKSELVRIARDVFSHAPALTVRVRAYEFKGIGPELVDRKWIMRRLDSTGLSQGEVAERLGIDKHQMSKIINGAVGFTRYSRAAFYYFFRTVELEG